LDFNSCLKLLLGKISPPSRIRTRVPYREYAELISVLLDQPTVGELVTWLQQKIDKKQWYGSETISDIALEDSAYSYRIME